MNGNKIIKAGDIVRVIAKPSTLPNTNVYRNSCGRVYRVKTTHKDRCFLEGLDSNYFYSDEVKVIEKSIYNNDLKS